MGRKRKSKFDEDFKRNAVKLALEGKKTQAEIAADLGISGYTLSRWKDELLSEGATARQRSALRSERWVSRRLARQSQRS